MSIRVLLALVSLLWLLGGAPGWAEVLVRWSQDDLPPQASLGVAAVVVPAGNPAAVRSALAAGYRVYLEIDAARLDGVELPVRGVTGVIVGRDGDPDRIDRLRRSLPDGVAVRILEDRGKRPHIRSNTVTSEGGVLQVAGRTAQPWIENNAALIRIAQALQPGTAPLITYPWQPRMPGAGGEEPELGDYLLAIAEAGSLGADLVLPVHEAFQKRLLLGIPRARAWWNEIRDQIAFYSWSPTTRYDRTADIGVVTGEDWMRWFEVMNLLARHNLAFDLLPREQLGSRDLTVFDMLIVLDRTDPGEQRALAAFAGGGGTVVLAAPAGSAPWHGAPPLAASDGRTTYRLDKGVVVELAEPIVDPNAFALEMRQLVGDGRGIQIWNGITVLAAHHTAPGSGTVLVTLLNYAYQPLEIQVRVPGTFSEVSYESPEQDARLIPFRHRDGYTEFVVPALRLGCRIFLE